MAKSSSASSSSYSTSSSPSPAPESYPVTRKSTTCGSGATDNRTSSCQDRPVTVSSNKSNNCHNQQNTNIPSVSGLTPAHFDALLNSTFSEIQKKQQQQQQSKSKTLSLDLRFKTTAPNEKKMSILTSTKILNPRHHLSFVALSVGFLLIWTCVISGLLLSNTLSEKAQIEDAVSVFNGHQDVGKVVFALGHEMVSAVDLLLTNPGPRSENIGYSKQSLQITWQSTDLILNQVISSNHMRLASIIRELNETWFEFRSRFVASQKTDPREAVEIYLNVCRILEKEYRNFSPASGSFMTGSVAYKNPSLVNSGISYSLFNSGMFKRFAQIAMGTYYIRSILPFNSSLYLDLEFTSRSLIESAFQFHPKAQSRYFELRGDEEQIEESLSVVRKDILNGGYNRSTNRLDITYLEGVKNEISRLLLTKDYLNSTIANQIKLITSLNKNNFWFYFSVTIIALIAILSCLILLSCSIRSVAYRSNPVKREVYKANMALKQHHQNLNDIRRSQSHLPTVDQSIFNTFGSLERNISMPITPLNRDAAAPNELNAGRLNIAHKNNHNNPHVQQQQQPPYHPPKFPQNLNLNGFSNGHLNHLNQVSSPPVSHTTSHPYLPQNNQSSYALPSYNFNNNDNKPRCYL